MDRPIFALAAGVAIASLGCPSPLVALAKAPLTKAVGAVFGGNAAEAQGHPQEPVSRTKEAIERGKAGRAAALLTHTRAALQTAEAAEQANDNPMPRKASRT